MISLIFANNWMKFFKIFIKICKSSSIAKPDKIKKFEPKFKIFQNKLKYFK